MKHPILLATTATSIMLIGALISSDIGLLISIAGVCVASPLLGSFLGSES